MSEVTSNWSSVAAVLDEGWVMHLAVMDSDGTALALPMLYVRDENSVLLHGAVGNDLLRRLDGAARIAGTVTLVDGLVVARSAFSSSVAYRCVMVRGSVHALHAQERSDALVRITDSLIPGRRGEIRDSTDGEVRATVVLRLEVDEATLRTSPLRVEDVPRDHGDAVWSGVVPLSLVAAEPQRADDVPADVPVPASVRQWRPSRT